LSAGWARSEQAQQHLQQMLRLGCRRANMKTGNTPLDGLLNSQFVTTAGVERTECDALALPVDALRLVFVDGYYNATLSDDIAGSGFTVTINDDRQTLQAPVQPEVFPA
jgi:Fe-S cluster assembly protein SufD